MVYVFKTSVKFKKQVKRLEPLLNDTLAKTNWNFDLEDCDKIFRVESAGDVSTQQVKTLFEEKGFVCEELE